MKIKNSRYSPFGTHLESFGAGDLMFEVVESSRASSIKGNNVRYIPLRRNRDDYIQFQTSIPIGVSYISLKIFYLMEGAENNNVVLRLDALSLNIGEDPSQALSIGTEFVITPGNDINLHLLDWRTFNPLNIPVKTGGFLIGKLVRPSSIQDTHTEDMQVVSIIAEI